MINIIFDMSLFFSWALILMLFVLTRIFSLFFICLQELEDPKASPTENDLIPLKEYRRNKLMRLSEMLRNKRNRFDDSIEEN